MPRLIDHCIFCNSTEKLTKEHIFGKWTRDIPSISPRTTHTTIYRNPNGTIDAGKGRFNRPGAPGSHQLRIVCTACNRGWMSSMQDQAIRPARRLANGDWSNITVAEGKVLTNWATMASMCYEFSDMKTQVVPLLSRKEFMLDKEPNSEFAVFLGQFNGIQDQFVTWHRGGIFGHTFGGTVYAEYLQTTVFNYGKMFILVMSGKHSILNLFKSIDKFADCYRIWPARTERFNGDEELGSRDDHFQPAAMFWNIFQAGRPQSEHLELR